MLLGSDSSLWQQSESRIAEGDSFDLADRNNRHFAKAVDTGAMAAAARDQLNAVAGHSAQKPGKAATLGAYGNDFIDIFAQRVDQTTPVISNTAVHKMVKPPSSEFVYNILWIIFQCVTVRRAQVRLSFAE